MLMLELRHYIQCSWKVFRIIAMNSTA